MSIGPPTALGVSAPLSVVVTVRDDRQDLEALLEALEAQDRPPEEVVVVDGGSTDGTLELLQRCGGRLPLRVLHAPGCNISAGRNIGIEAATHDHVVCTDAGCRPVPGWLRAFASAFDGGADFAGGVYRVAGHGPLATALAVALYPDVAEIDDASAFVNLSHRLFGRTFDPASTTGRSVAFHRHVWRRAGGFPEDVYAGEDVAFSAAAVARATAPTLVADAIVDWEPRPTWRANARMYRTYGRGDAAQGRARRHAIRGAAWLAWGAAVVGGGRPGRAAAGAGVAAYLSLPVRRALRRRAPAAVWVLLPAVTVMKDLALVAGALDVWLGRADGGRPA